LLLRSSSDFTKRVKNIRRGRRNIIQISSHGGFQVSSPIHSTNFQISEQLLSMPRINVQEMCTPTEYQQDVPSEAKIDEADVVKIAED
jgi:hypothetical protein